VSSTNNNNITEIFDSFQYLKVLIVGDSMTDKYIFGNANRISPEAPVPIIEVYRRESRLGGAANVALNIKELGAKPILATVVGDDEDGYEFKQILQSHQIDPSYTILDQDRRTTVKTRIISRNQQVLRYDHEQTQALDENTELLLLDSILDIIYSEKPNVVIMQDYNKGVLTPKVIANIIHHCQQAEIPTAIDPKRDNFFAYKGCTLFKPNLKEAADALQTDLSHLRPEALIEADVQLREVLQNKYTVITLSDKGIFIGMEDDNEMLPAYLRRIVDVSGAGDTVIALLALGLALDLPIFATAELANIAAGMVCEQVGVVAINCEALQREAEMVLGE
jgi:rfaE bifunctional protein kinase chain/domain